MCAGSQRIAGLRPAGGPRDLQQHRGTDDLVGLGLRSETGGMEAAELRAVQGPLKQRYREEPATARTPLRARADFRDDGITCTVDGWSSPVRAGLHPACGGGGEDACSGDLLLQALLACAGVTVRSVATAFGVPVRSAKLSAQAVFDARGTLGIDPEVPVGISDAVVRIELDCDADDLTMRRISAATERYCVVSQSLKRPPTFHILRVGTSAEPGGGVTG